MPFCGERGNQKEDQAFFGGPLKKDTALEGSSCFEFEQPEKGGPLCCS